MTFVYNAIIIDNWIMKLFLHHKILIWLVWLKFSFAKDSDLYKADLVYLATPRNAKRLNDS